MYQKRLTGVANSISKLVCQCYKASYPNEEAFTSVCYAGIFMVPVFVYLHLRCKYECRNVCEIDLGLRICGADVLHVDDDGHRRLVQR